MAEDESVERRLGTTLRGKWTLKRVLGVGGMAAVYVGEHKIGREDAIKILHPEVALSKNVRARFEQEAHAANRLKHPAVVEIRDIDVTEDGAPFMVMELLSGEPLSSRMKRLGTLSAPEVLRYADELLDVLAAAHAQGIIHRDVKPDNLFILEDGRLKVLDFGIARMKEGAPKTMHTRAGSTLGTVAYMPPEQTMSSKIDERADLFAVGATMFRLLARRYIHEAKSEMDLLVKMASEPAPPLASVAPSVPPEVCLVVDRALAFERARRYPDARTMQADVRAVRAGGTPSYAAGRLATDGPPGSVTGAALGAGAVAGPVSGAVAGPVSGAVAGPVPGAVAGPVSGAVAGPVSGAAAGAVAGGFGEMPTVLDGRIGAGPASLTSSPSLAPLSSAYPPSPPPSSMSPSPLPSSMSPSPLPSSMSPLPSASSTPPQASASSIMPVLARRADLAKSDAEAKRKRLLAGVAVAVVALLAVVGVLAAGGSDETEGAAETAADDPGTAKPSVSTGPSSKPGDKGKGKVKWRKPRGSGE